MVMKKKPLTWRGEVTAVVDGIAVLGNCVWLVDSNHLTVAIAVDSVGHDPTLAQRSHYQGAFSIKPNHNWGCTGTA